MENFEFTPLSYEAYRAGRDERLPTDQIAVGGLYVVATALRHKNPEPAIQFPVRVSNLNLAPRTSHYLKFQIPDTDSPRVPFYNAKLVDGCLKHVSRLPVGNKGALVLEGYFKSRTPEYDFDELLIEISREMAAHQSVPGVKVPKFVPPIKWAN